MRLRLPAWTARLGSFAFVVEGILLRTVMLVVVLFSASRVVAPTAIEVPSGEVQLRVVPRLPGGRLIVPLGPLGQVSWRVDRAPVDIEANVLIDPDAASLPSAEDLDLGRFRSRLIATKLLWVVLFGMAGGLLAVQGTSIAPGRAAVGGVLVTVAAVAVVAVLTWATFDESQLANPRYRGPIKDVTRVVQLMKEINADFPGTKRNIARAVEGLARIRRQLLVDADPSESADTVRLLFVSDMHNNPLGMLIAERLASQFEVAGVIDAGDFTDRGTAIEAELFARYGRLGVPHVIAPGNHEDRAAIVRVEQIPTVTVLAGRADSAEIAGIAIVGAADPNASSIESDPRNDQADREMPLVCEEVAALVERERPQVVLVHDKRAGECAARAAEEADRPLVFAWGHDHKAAFKKRGSVVSVSPGTSGANGPKSPVTGSYGFALLEFDRATKLPVSVCLFAFARPEALGDASCHVLDRDAA